MEQSRRYNWIWAKRKNNDDSWEEQAFAEDAARYVEDYTWPPKSYSCSFCGREFKSAQALGGHMNVHRRDRARLKQPPNTSNNTPTHPPPLPPPALNNFFNPLLPSMAADPIRVPPLHSRILYETQKISRFSSAEESFSDQIFHSRSCNSTKEESQLIEKADNSSVNFGLLVEYSISSKDVISTPTNSSCKRRRMLDSPESNFTLLPKSKVIRLSLSHDCIEELDLELRLGGDPPK